MGLPLALVSLVVLGIGCSAPDPGTVLDYTDDSASAASKNPDGVAYPTAHLGGRARGVGQNGKPNKTPGDVMRNLKFMGYPDGDASKPLQPMSLADFYDPQAKRSTIIHIMYSDGWCPDCQQELAVLVKALKDPKVDYRKKGVVYLEAVGEGTSQGSPAMKVDLDAWVNGHPKLFA